MSLSVRETMLAARVPGIRGERRGSAEVRFTTLKSRTAQERDVRVPRRCRSRRVGHEGRRVRPASLSGAATGKQRAPRKYRRSIQFIADGRCYVLVMSRVMRTAVIDT